MINEIFDVWRSLKGCPCHVTTRHPWIKPLSKSGALIVRVAVSENQVLIFDVEYRNKEEASRLWKVEKNKFNTFPGLNLYGPIFRADPELSHVKLIVEKKLTTVELATCLDKVVKTGALFDNKKQDGRIKGLWNRIHVFPHEELLPLVVGQDPQYGALEALIRVFESLKTFDKTVMQTFLSGLARVAVERCRDGRLDSGLDLLQNLIVGKWDKSKGGFEEAVVSIFFDLSDYDQLKIKNPIKVTDRRMMEFISKRLLARSVSSVAETGICSLTGNKGSLENGKLPNPTLPVIGGVYLMSMDKNALCHDRYGLGSTADVFPITRNTAQSLSDALRYITNEARRGKTWIAVPSGRKKPDLLISYVEEMPDEEFENARLLGGTEQTTETDFDALSSTVCDALRNKIPVAENYHLRMFVIRQISKGQTQLVLAERLTIRSLFDAVSRWREGARNRPPFSLRLPGRVKGDKAVITSPLCPFPSEIVDLLRRQWIRDGTDNREIQGAKLGEAYEVFFSQERAKPAAGVLLRRTIERVGPLLLGVGKADHSSWKSDQDRKQFTIESKRVVLRALSVFGILLFTLGRKKEVYMKDAPYYIGRMFALADLLHSQYCEHVRKTELPGQLIGNAHLRIALQDPAKGLARLEERLIIYKAWADKFRGDKAGLAKWCLREMGKVSECLAEKGIPSKMDDLARAEVLLGYLAHPEKEEKQT